MALLRRIANLLRRARLDSDIAAELRAHVELRMEDNVARGMSLQEARREAMIRFGNDVVLREKVVAVDASLGLEHVWRDVRHALRLLMRSPGFALTAIVTLALGIGANVVVFGVLNGLLLRPLNVAHQERLFQVVNQDTGDDNLSYPDFVDFRRRNHAFADMAAYKITMAGAQADGLVERSWAFEVSSNYFETLGVRPQLGRFFYVGDEHGINSMPYVVLSDGIWRRRFHADPGVIGSIIKLNKIPFTVLGVAPREFNGTEVFLWPDFWIPMMNEPQLDGYNYLEKRSSHGIFALGFLKSGVSSAEAVQDLNAISIQLAREYPGTDSGSRLRLVKPGLMGDVLGGPARPFLTATMLLALLVLAAACVNLAVIFSARVADRTREIAIRLSIGSTRTRIVRQLLTEAFLIAAAGGAAATAVAICILRVLSDWTPIAEFPIRVTVVADGRVIATAVCLSLASGILPGLLPARQVWRADAMQAMKASAVELRNLFRLKLRDVLLFLQIAVCAFLVMASLVALRGMQRSLHAPVGFIPEGALVVRMEMKMAGYTDAAAYPVQRRMLDEVARLPGVQALGSVNHAPLGGEGDTWSVYRQETRDFRPSTEVFSAHAYIVSPGFLAAAQTRLLQGRDFTWADGPAAARVAIVNQTFARRLFGNERAVGSRYAGGDKRLYEIVGVVEDGKYESLTENATPAEFVPIAQENDSEITLVLRSKAGLAETASAVQSVLHSIDSSLPFSIEPWSQTLSLVLFPSRVATAALGILGTLAALLAITGIFGMAAYTVSRRLRELGIRVALGARRMQLVRSALARPAVLLAVGSSAGLILGLAASRLIAAIVYTATVWDPIVLPGALFLMLLVGLVATWIPAHRALGINPAHLLREN